MSSYSSPEPRPEPTTSTSGGMKVLLAVLIVFGVCCLLCCGGTVWFVYWAGNKVQEIAANTFSDDPARITARAEQIIELDMPPGLEPDTMMNITNPLNGEPVMVWTVWRDPDDGTSLFLAEYSEEMFPEADVEQVRQEMEKSMREQGEGGPEEINVEETGTVPAVINGEETSFVVLRGRQTSDPNAPPDAATEQPEAERVTVEGTFKSELGRGFLILQGPSERFTDEEIEQFIRSIK